MGDGSTLSPVLITPVGAGTACSLPQAGPAPSPRRASRRSAARTGSSRLAAACARGTRARPSAPACPPRGTPGSPMRSIARRMLPSSRARSHRRPAERRQVRERSTDRLARDAGCAQRFDCRRGVVRVRRDALAPSPAAVFRLPREQRRRRAASAPRGRPGAARGSSTPSCSSVSERAAAPPQGPVAEGRLRERDQRPRDGARHFLLVRPEIVERRAGVLPGRDEPDSGPRGQRRTCLPSRLGKAAVGQPGANGETE